MISSVRYLLGVVPGHLQEALSKQRVGHVHRRCDLRQGRRGQRPHGQMSAGCFSPGGRACGALARHLQPQRFRQHLLELADSDQGVLQGSDGTGLNKIRNQVSQCFTGCSASTRLLSPGKPCACQVSKVGPLIHMKNSLQRTPRWGP